MLGNKFWANYVGYTLIDFFRVQGFLRVIPKIDLLLTLLGTFVGIQIDTDQLKKSC